tara:strand:- start:296 stop:994 length:699 start_codon:yes stop_codon:yes gene_type:complete
MNLKIYITHYSPLKERYIFIKNQLDKYEFNYEFITNYDRDNITKNELFIFNLNKLKMSEISLFYKHIYSYKKIIDESNNNTYSLILEDDAKLCDNFKDKLEIYLSQLPEDYDMLFIGNGCNLHIPNNKIQPNKYIYFKNNIPIACQLDIKNWNVNWGIGVARCTDSYLISKNCANKILNYFNNINIENSINHPIDFWLNDIIKILNLNIYWAEPTIISQGTQCGIFKSSIGH